MLSLLSLLLASGTVLRVDTDEWTSITYPDPRTNSELCNTWQNSTLCDPDHILTDQWRADIDGKLEKVDIQYTDHAPESCIVNASEPIKIYLLLAKRIKTTSNESISHSDLTTFGDELLEAYGLNNQDCKNFLILIGVQSLEVAYVRTGKDLKLPSDLMQRIFSQSTKLFSARNYMENLSKIIEDIGNELLLLFKDESTNAILNELKKSTETADVETTESLLEHTSVSTLPPSTQTEKSIVTWILIVTFGVLILITIAVLGLQFIRKYQRQAPVETQTVTSVNSGELAASPRPEKRFSISEGEDDACDQEDEPNPYMAVKVKDFHESVVDETSLPTSVRKEHPIADSSNTFNDVSQNNETSVKQTAKFEAPTTDGGTVAAVQQTEDSLPSALNSKFRMNPIDLSTDFIKSLSPFKVFQSGDNRFSSKL